MNASTLPSPSAIRCATTAFAVRRVPVAEVPPLRQKTHPTLGQLLPANILRHADDQSVVGLAAVLHAITDYQLDPDGFTDWGVICAPRFLGRATMAQALQRFAQEGAWGISPHLIPHRSLHGPSGTISQALKIHGPNIGVGGGPYAAAEGLLIASAMLARDQLPGVWLVMTGVEDEAVFTAAKPICSAVALALVAREQGELALEIASGQALVHPEDEGVAPFLLETLLAALTTETAPTTASWRLACGGRLQLTRNAVREEKFRE